MRAFFCLLIITSLLNVEVPSLLFAELSYTPFGPSSPAGSSSNTRSEKEGKSTVPAARESYPTGPYSIKDASYKIAASDNLQIVVADEPDLSKELTVSMSGDINFPLLGRVKVQGLTVSEIEQLLTQKLTADFIINPQVSVVAKEFSNIFVYGEVSSPGSYPLQDRITLLEAIILAGGFSTMANPRKVKVVRVEDGQQKTFVVNVNDIIKKGDKSKDIYLKPRDTVIVPEGLF